MDERILVVEDEVTLNRMVCDYLSYHGFKPTPTYNGQDAMSSFRAGGFDLVVLDRMLPQMDGLAVARAIRAESTVPIIMLTAKAEEADRVEGLDTGADDYVTKPFSMKELAARVRAQLRRASVGRAAEAKADATDPGAAERHTALSHRGVVLDTLERTAHVDGRPVSLTQVQFDILQRMMGEPGRVFTRRQLLESVQDHAFEGYERTVDVHIKNIRKAIEPNPGAPTYLLTVRGVGYKVARGEESE